MAGITLAQAEAKLALWMEADDKVSRGQSYEIGDRKLTRADAKEITEKITFWQGWVQRLSVGGSRVTFGVPS